MFEHFARVGAKYTVKIESWCFSTKSTHEGCNFIAHSNKSTDVKQEQQKM